MAKTIEIIAGPNGSGKTTFTDKALEKRKNAISINTDKIAGGLTPSENEFAQYEAGRFMLEMVDNALNNGQSFTFETTMSGRIWTSYLKRAKVSGYKVKIYFVFVQTIALSLKRIRHRVKHGGHNIPENVVRRRFDRTFKNFVNLYMPLADEWYIIDNSNKGELIASRKGKKEVIRNSTIFKKYFHGKNNG